MTTLPEDFTKLADQARREQVEAALRDSDAFTELSEKIGQDMTGMPIELVMERIKQFQADSFSDMLLVQAESNMHEAHNPRISADQARELLTNSALLVIVNDMLTMARNMSRDNPDTPVSLVLDVMFDLTMSSDGTEPLQIALMGSDEEVSTFVELAVESDQNDAEDK